jgi:hypothetical protein
VFRYGLSDVETIFLCLQWVAVVILDYLNVLYMLTFNRDDEIDGEWEPPMISK